jgi:hypothetical protein
MLITITSLERLAALEALSQLHDPNDPEPESFLGYVLPAIDRARVAEFVVELAQQEATRLRQIAERQIEVAKEHPIVDLNLGRFWIAEFLGLEPVDPPSADRRPLVDARTAVRMAERAGPYVASLISKELARAQAALSLLVSPSEVARQAEAEAEATGVLEPAHDIIRQPAQAALEPKTVEREWLRIGDDHTRGT